MPEAARKFQPKEGENKEKFTLAGDPIAEDIVATAMGDEAESVAAATDEKAEKKPKITTSVSKDKRGATGGREHFKTDFKGGEDATMETLKMANPAAAEALEASQKAAAAKLEEIKKSDTPPPLPQSAVDKHHADLYEKHKDNPEVVALKKQEAQESGFAPEVDAHIQDYLAASSQMEDAYIDYLALKKARPWYKLRAPLAEKQAKADWEEAKANVQALTDTLSNIGVDKASADEYAQKVKSASAGKGASTMKTYRPPSSPDSSIPVNTMSPGARTEKPIGSRPIEPARTAGEKREDVGEETLEMMNPDAAEALKKSKEATAAKEAQNDDQEQPPALAA